jgi:S-DNA-T family DNA segregation ATPase FtsK/SpoIIIE
VGSEVGFSLVAQGIQGALAIPLRAGGALIERLRQGPPGRTPRRSTAKPSMRVVRRDAPVLEEDEEDEEEVALPPPSRKPAAQIKLPLPAPKADKPAAPARPAPATTGDLPTTDLLNAVVPSGEAPTDEELKGNAKLLEKTLAEFGILGQVREVHPGPVVTMYEFEPGPGIKVNQIVTRADDLALALRAARIRILAPIPGKAAVGVEVPNPKPQTVFAREIVEAEAFRHGQGRLLIGLGKDTGGKVFVTDLTKAPHLLVAGSTGSGKSVGMNMILNSLLLRHSPESLRLLLIDPKMLELTTYNGIPHLLWPVVTQAKPAARALRWTVAEMERRYKTLSTVGVRHIDSYNAQMAQQGGERLPYIVVMVDELADLMLTLPAEIEEPIARLAQMARAVGIHLIVATQRPSVDVITGVIKANFPSRMAFQVASKVDSRTILDMNGADTLLGNGDMLFLPAGRPEPIRIHGAYISDSEAEAIAGFWRAKAPVAAPPPADLDKEPAPGEEGSESGDDDDDQLVAEAARLVVLSQRGSVSLLQRRLKIGYSRAGRIMDKLESIGVVGPFEGSQAREVLVDERFLEEHGYGKTSG